MTTTEEEVYESEEDAEGELPFTPISVLVAQVLEDYLAAKARHEAKQKP